MYSKISNLVLGFHGCDESVYNKVIMKNEPLKPSTNDYDWLGNGIYFWEQNYERALEWAKMLVRMNKIQTPAVIGAVIDLGHCLNFMDSHEIKFLKKQYYSLKAEFDLLGKELPKNENVGDSTDLLYRYLDCFIIQELHLDTDFRGEPAYDSVRGIFIEGKPIYENSGIHEKSHIQICIRNPNCIKGYFTPKVKGEL